MSFVLITVINKYEIYLFKSHLHPEDIVSKLVEWSYPYPVSVLRLAWYTHENFGNVSFDTTINL